jgi:multidrug efflux pump subunit AcrA (membrane-fusion protein)
MAALCPVPARPATGLRRNAAPRRRRLLWRRQRRVQGLSRMQPMQSKSAYARSPQIIVGALVLALAAGAAWWWQARQAAQAPQYRMAAIERGSGGGVGVRPRGRSCRSHRCRWARQVSGQIRELYADFNSEVKAGQIIAQIDPQLIEFQVRQAQADL